MTSCAVDISTPCRKFSAGFKTCTLFLTTIGTGRLAIATRPAYAERLPELYPPEHALHPPLLRVHNALNAPDNPTFALDTRACSRVSCGTGQSRSSACSTRRQSAQRQAAWTTQGFGWVLSVHAQQEQG